MELAGLGLFFIIVSLIIFVKLDCKVVGLIRNYFRVLLIMTALVWEQSYILNKIRIQTTIKIWIAVNIL